MSPQLVNNPSRNFFSNYIEAHGLHLDLLQYMSYSNIAVETAEQSYCIFEVNYKHKAKIQTEMCVLELYRDIGECSILIGCGTNTSRSDCLIIALNITGK